METSSGRRSLTCRTYIAAVFVLAISYMPPAQGIAGEGRYGFYGGLNFANMTGDMGILGPAFADFLGGRLPGSAWYSDEGRVPALGGGGYLFLQLSEVLGFQLEGQYMRRGTRFDLRETTSNLNVEMDILIDYIEIPLLLRLTPLSDSSFQTMFVVGPVIGFRARAKIVARYDGEEDEIDAGRLFDSATFGAIGGVGLTYRLNDRESLFLQGRYYLGISNVFNDRSWATTRHSDFGVFVGMEFTIPD